MLILILFCRLRSHVSDEVGLETVKPTLSAFDSLRQTPLQGKQWLIRSQMISLPGYLG